LSASIDAFLLRIKRKNIPLLLIVKRGTTTVFALRDNYVLSAPPTASQTLVPGGATETEDVSNDGHFRVADHPRVARLGVTSD